MRIEASEGPGKFTIPDNHKDFKLGQDEDDDKFSVSSMSKASSVDDGAGLFEFQATTGGDEALAPPQEEAVEEEAEPPPKPKKWQYGYGEDVEQVVKATIDAWKTCPGIVKKQMDD